MKRVLLFIATNLAVVLVLGIVLNVIFSVTGLQYGRGNIASLLVLAAVFGFGGSFISLAISKWMAKRSTGAHVITNPANETERWLVDTVQRQAAKAGIGMPEVAIYPGQEINAFATGMKRNDALVAVSVGLLNNMTRDEAEAVLAHEVSHVANGDMITMSLLQGVVNTFVIFFARIVANIIDNFLRGDEEGGGLGGFAYFGVVMVLELVFGILASTIVMWFSRQREFRADEGSARLVGKEKMIAALERLKQPAPETQLEGQLAAFGINGKKSMSEFFMSHPPLDKRIEALRNMR
ncbi:MULTISPECIES: protease HtpX [Corallincola]|uniref:Protease HtpX n=3 Tax=Corallincola TaxID=1775176 RepID=A0A368NS92_9GAMM|nr:MULTISPECIES: protease HtpX [Corallincola]RCU52695.1 protease HtpX [Corallincola holothuriorum]TAA48125.1 protease HtpX [Corallincola spongiicola]TCI03195.1 protease HtpX [Corallincola luteus]